GDDGDGRRDPRDPSGRPRSEDPTGDNGAVASRSLERLRCDAQLARACGHAAAVSILASRSPPFPGARCLALRTGFPDRPAPGVPAAPRPAAPPSPRLV